MPINKSDEFPVVEHIIHLNHAAVAPWPKVTADIVAAFAEENSRQGSLNYPHWLIVEAELRQRAARLINAPDPLDIALVKNTSEGLSFVGYGLDWKAGDNVVGIRQEFPSNRFVWASLKDRGVEFRQLDLTQCGPDPETELMALCDKQTRLLAVSAVQYANGLRMDLPTLGKFCRERSILFCVDAIQQLGAISFDVKKIGADFVIADGHKWMLGPEGLGLFYVRREVLDQLRLHQFGWHMAENAGDFDREDFTPAPDARRFECGSPNMLGIHALNASLGLLLETGMDEIWRQIDARIDFLIQALNKNPDVEILSDTRPQRRSGILTFRVNGLDNELLFNHLKNNNVFCALRGGGIRLSPHFYTPFEQLQRTLELIRETASKSEGQ